MSRHLEEVFANLLQLGRLCAAFVRLQQVTSRRIGVGT